jgi:glutamate synthase domain-containing protein 1
MCIIAASPAGAPQPNMDTLRRMFINNPHGAGYMTARNGRVEISKGFMTWADFARAVRQEAFTAADPVVYHFRISTQAGVNPEMTHPFPLTSHIEQCKLWDVACPIGVAHNGIIRLTSNSRDKEYSDTAHYRNGSTLQLSKIGIIYNISFNCKFSHLGMNYQYY